MSSKSPHQSLAPLKAAENSAVEPAHNGAETGAEPAEEMDAAELEQLLDQYSGDEGISSGEIRPATVVNITSDGVVVDLGLKSEGVVPLAEFSDENGQPTIQPGDTTEVLVEASQPREGYVPCSSEGAHRRRLWDEVDTAYREKKKVTCRVVARVKGGFQVEINLLGAHPGRRPLSAFLPGSQVDLKRVRYWEGFLNRELPCRILKLNRRRGNLVVSRRLLLGEEQAQRKKLLEEVLKEGAVLTGTVKNLTDYGAFVDLGGLDGLLHITDMSYRRLSHPSEGVSPGDQIQVKVLKVDKEKERISLGMKQLEPDPWEGAPKKYKVGERVRGRVTHLVDFGAFVELEPGIEGLIHVSEMSWTKRIRHPQEILNEGDWVEAVVLDLQPGEQRISLGLRQTRPDPFRAVAEKFPPGSVVRGRVKSLTDFGAFIELEPGVEGLAHVSELSWDKKLKQPSRVLQRDQEVEAKVLKVDVLNRRLSLSLKDLQPDPWATYASRARIEQVVRGRISRRTTFGLFVELAPGVEGLCHSSELLGEDDELEVGQEHDFKIIKVNPNERRLGLSRKAIAGELERRAVDQYRASQPRSTATLQEILSSKRQSITPEKS
ncbi:MAG: 30S ribosomal protein S1 [Candidatus Acidoferrales bacterium]